ncbi:hypothetical protein [Nocardioides insulae]|uniref:hypothetical protein n=1 Tax=Nocardioides insulae TaxID=394734 RepID=UPI0004197821|nr:hypothetical protein [Nocardioides insulae]
MENPTATDRTREFEPTTLQRHSLKSRHAQGLNRLMEEREDLRGVNALADIAYDSLRWSA